MTIDGIREHIRRNIGNDIMVTYNEGRNKVSFYYGKVVEVYPNVFIILDNDNKRSFSYYDILTKTAKISFRCKKNVNL